MIFRVQAKYLVKPDKIFNKGSLMPELFHLKCSLESASISYYLYLQNVSQIHSLVTTSRVTTPGQVII